MDIKVTGSKSTPLTGKISYREKLSSDLSSKNCFALQITHETPIDYLAGDTIAIFPQNNPAEVEAILALLQKTGDELIVDPRKNDSLSLRSFLQERVNLDRHPKAPDLLTFLETENGPFDPLTLPPLLPRFYSITSSSRLNPSCVDLLITTFTKQVGIRQKEGVASCYLCSLAKINQTPICFYIQSSPHFRLPKEPNLPIIMIGPGTGVAPFRAFMQERHLSGAKNNYLFFGEREEKNDFYYADFWKEHVKNGFLTLFTAFSRDGKEKVYVQHRLFENKELIWEQILKGAIIYICGDAKQMAKDVTFTLQKIAQTCGNLSESESSEWIKTMRKEGKLRLDVY